MGELYGSGSMGIAIKRTLWDGVSFVIRFSNVVSFTVDQPPV
jgi:hypothetical protein